jgi:hypothetical protein
VGIRHHRTLEFVGIMNLSPKVLEFWDSVTEIRPVRHNLSRDVGIRPTSLDSGDLSSGKLLGIRHFQ